MIALLLMTLDEEERNRILLLWQENGAALVLYAQKELGSAGTFEDAQDIVSEAFERLMIHFERYERLSEVQMKGLLFRIVRNLCMDFHRKKKRAPVLDPYDDAEKPESGENPAEQTPEDLVISEDTVQRMQKVFLSLSPALREVLEMKLNEEMTDEEIAEELHITASGVRTRLVRARRQVRIKWEEEEHE